MLGLAHVDPSDSRVAWVVEDHDPSRDTIAETLRARGHSVVAFAGIDDLDDEVARWQGQEVRFREVRAALFDHYFLGPFNGAILTRRLSMQAPRAAILAMSSDGAANRRMLEAGATLALRKSELIRIIRRDVTAVKPI